MSDAEGEHDVASLGRRIGELEYRQNVLEAAFRWTLSLGPCLLLLIAFVVVKVTA